MNKPLESVLIASLTGMLCVAGDLRAEKSTVCTITVNSADEREMFRRYLPEDSFQFVELVEKGRPDWLASACRQRVQCDVLVISGHFNGTEFFSEHVDSREYLPVEEMERASCSESCPGLFSKLKEVYLFGCNSLNPEVASSVSAEVARSLIRSGRSRADAERVSRALNERHGESNRDGMRRIFMSVPVIYGFSSTAPTGPVAATTLNRYFQSASSAEVGRGRASPRLLAQFAANAMSVAGGLRTSDPKSRYRDEVCQFYDDRLSAAETLEFIHRILVRDPAEVRMFLERIENFVVSLTESQRGSPSFVRTLDQIANDHVARDRYLAFARDSDEPAVRARMIKLGRSLTWLSAEDERVALVELVNDLLARSSIAPADVDLICSLNQRHELDAELGHLDLAPPQAAKATHAASLACFGSEQGRTQILRALTGPSDEGVRIAQVYLQYRPLTDVSELRGIAARIALMTDADAQVRALNALASHYLSDRESLDELMRLYPNARSVHVQRAIAGIFIRSDYGAIDKRELVGVLRQHRLKSPEGEDLIDVLIRRLQSA